MNSPVAASMIVQAWQRAYGAEVDAIYGYGALGPHLAGVPVTQIARECQQDHRDRAQQAAIEIAASGALLLAGDGGYQLPFPVADSQSAQQLALQLEESTGAAWRYVLAVIADLPPSAGSASWRTAAVAAMTQSAVNAVQWRRLLTPARASVPFPGL
jgi:hypothetical protein